MMEKLHITGACAAWMAYLAILWISGDAGTAQQTKHGGLYEPWWGSATPGVLAMVEDTQVDYLEMGHQGWDPGEMYIIREGPTVKERYRSEGLHSVYKFEGMIWVYVITGIVMEWDPGEIKSDSEMYLQEVSMAKEVIGGHVIKFEGMIARVEQDMVDQSASFGWCTNDRGTDAEDDATSLKNCSSQEMVDLGPGQRLMGERR